MPIPTRQQKHINMYESISNVPKKLSIATLGSFPFRTCSAPNSLSFSCFDKKPSDTASLGLNAAWDILPHYPFLTRTFSLKIIAIVPTSLP